MLDCVVSELEITNVLGRCARCGIKLGIVGHIRVSPQATEVIQRDVVPQLPDEEAREVRSRLANGFRRGWDVEDNEDDMVEEVAELKRSS
jgi:citrate lyase beta subunit